ncbi:MAG: SDR family oxidoreductase [Desulfobulbus sp.]|nr:SDR family oxidoreductase [Desulfobulbus sp.]
MIGSCVLVTGGTGVTGRPLVAALLAMGREVVVLSRKPPQNDENQSHPSCTHLQGDVSQPLLGLMPEVYDALANRVETIFHLAARTDFKGKSLEDYQGINIDGVRHAYALAKRAGAHLHHVSTAFVRGDYGGIFHEEELDCNQGFRNNYEASKCKGEQYLRAQIAAQTSSNGPGVTIYRPGIILERHPSQNSVNTFGPFIFLDGIFRILLADHRRGELEQCIRVRGRVEGSLPFIFDDDVVEAILCIAATPGTHNRTFHLLASDPCPNRMMEQVFNAAFGRTTACMSPAESFVANPPSAQEKLLARKTAIYDAYLDLNLRFDRRELEAILGPDWRPAITEEELLAAFSHYLAGKKQGERALVFTAADPALIDQYFTVFLPQFLGRQLIAGLKSLSCRFWLQIAPSTVKTLEIQQGCLVSIDSDYGGTFGYQVQPATFLQVVAALLPPQQGFFQGDISLEGNTMEALRTAAALEEFFRTYPFTAAQEQAA